MSKLIADPFERHGIDHLSPSSLRMWREAPVVWIGKYLLRAEDQAGPGAWRGKAVEIGVDRMLFGFSHDDAVKAMYGQFALDQMGELSPEIEKELGALEDFLLQAKIAFDGKPMPFSRQSKVQLALPGISVPLIGFIDWLWLDRGDDLKTTWRIPSTVDANDGHVQQIACYAMHTGLPFSLTYVSPKKWTRHEIIRPVIDDAYDQVIETALAIRSFLDHVRDAHDALSMFAPDYSDFHFRPPMVEAIRNAKAIRPLSIPRSEP